MKLFFTTALILNSFFSFSQNEWRICNAPDFSRRVDDIFMVNTQIGYSVCGDGRIVKTIDGGDNWFQQERDSTVYCRSVEFINADTGFVGGFKFNQPYDNILRRTYDGGTTWTDITPLINANASRGICGLAVADKNTIYGCGNWYQEFAYIIKSIDGGKSWDYIDMGTYASTLIDMYFLNKDTGFVTGGGPLPFNSAVILYTTDGGLNWTTKYQNTTLDEYCWKIQKLTDSIYFASIEDLTPVPPSILKSTDGGMSWTKYQVDPIEYNIEGIGFIDSLHGWTGGDTAKSFESIDGGLTWNEIDICPRMNRVIRVNDSLMFATGEQIWKYSPKIIDGIKPIVSSDNHFATMICNPNPANEKIEISISLSKMTRALIVLLDQQGKMIKKIENADKPKGDFHYVLNTNEITQGIYFVVFKTHEDKVIKKIIINHE